MTADPDILLRMLEPAVRPAGTPAPAKAAAPPIEQRDFDALLAEAASPQPGQARPSAGSSQVKEHPLAALAGYEAIENASLRALREPGHHR